MQQQQPTDVRSRPFTVLEEYFRQHNACVLLLGEDQVYKTMLMSIANNFVMNFVPGAQNTYPMPMYGGGQPTRPQTYGGFGRQSEAAMGYASHQNLFASDPLAPIFAFRALLEQRAGSVTPTSVSSTGVSPWPEQPKTYVSAFDINAIDQGPIHSNLTPRVRCFQFKPASIGTMSITDAINEVMSWKRKTGLINGEIYFITNVSVHDVDPEKPLDTEAMLMGYSVSMMEMDRPRPCFNLKLEVFQKDDNVEGQTKFISHLRGFDDLSALKGKPGYINDRPVTIIAVEPELAVAGADFSDQLVITVQDYKV